MNHVMHLINSSEWGYVKGYYLYLDGKVKEIEEALDGIYKAKVESGTEEGKVYDVLINDIEKTYKCTCPYSDNGNNNPSCKHCMAVILTDEINRGYVNLSYLGCFDRKIDYSDEIIDYIRNHYKEQYDEFDDEYHGLKKTMKLMRKSDDVIVDTIKNEIPELAKFLKEHADSEHRNYLFNKGDEVNDI